ncbi:hypothetical protein BVX98_05725 [bacterium F11]|nr:hypothetical protein BVX98_05725 [bacterium F11]
MGMDPGLDRWLHRRNQLRNRRIVGLGAKRHKHRNQTIKQKPVLILKGWLKIKWGNTHVFRKK